MLGFASVKGILWIPSQEILVSGLNLTDLMSLHLLPALLGGRGLQMRGQGDRHPCSAGNGRKVTCQAAGVMTAAAIPSWGARTLTKSGLGAEELY